MRFHTIVVLMFVLSLLTACTQPRGITKSKNNLLSEPRKMLIKWYDPTYKSYYGVKGRVKAITIYIDDDIGEKYKAKEWLVEFDTRGRLFKKTVMNDNPLLESFYYYTDDKTRKIVSKIDGKEWRSTEYVYNQNHDLVNIRYIDNQSQQTFEQVVAKYTLKSGWFRIYQFINSMDVPQYRYFNLGHELIWSSKLVVDNGANIYLLDAADSVSSATVKDPFQLSMRPVGGYVYAHDNDGRLTSITSFNSNNNSEYHTTHYNYDNMGLLQSENKQVVGKSTFNDSVDVIVTYRYDELDNVGNWLKRTAFIKNGDKNDKIVQQRKISYY